MAALVNLITINKLCTNSYKSQILLSYIKKAIINNNIFNIILTLVNPYKNVEIKILKQTYRDFVLLVAFPFG